MQLEDASGQPATADAITGTLGTTTVAGVTLRFERTRNGEWVAHSIAPVAGEWTVALSVDFGTGAQYATSAVYRVWG
ncbi:hypothetical protein ACRAWC_15445 [Leifsonia sp. L25]|uniref:hypothetical protein n=1 Tax=Leifsonia sp. L25 TaxID=3423957 RepID=UPI003D69CC96